MSNESIDNIAARLAIADAVLATVKESGLLRTKRRAARRARRPRRSAADIINGVETPSPRRTRRSSTKRRSARRKPRNPLANVPDTTEATPQATV